MEDEIGQLAIFVPHLLDLPVRWKDNTGWCATDREVMAVGTTVVSVLEISCAACKCAIADGMTESTNSPAGPDLASASFLNPILTGAAMGLPSVSVGATAVRLTSSDESPTAR
ncbi:hypothetical protein MMARJ_11160 [Mycobacterium marseillense]|uniref:Uncharacterized protein n=3 Tax=Mycobacterium avium complex (MAC) TaxID=120793 RepID=A0ABM7J987_9MYCO|nr:hypothetical protein W7S_14110 [Mycobacterium sp. MOTT36Y]OCB16002.1 hypothetical protein A5644_25110 [Mycobacterium intracellulare subsp. yongonense]ORA86695.1 hypothetical protein BST31_22720 [Mycobacterium marseillense]PBJ64364.1 hypothetical protein BB736_01270 [Mycobacterium avium subsp. hominissuis]GFG96198.1 hypothetical protein MTIM_20770 [Mycobacterium timonense]